MSKAKKTAIQPTREEDYSEWYQQVIKAAQLAEASPVRGCMAMKPWGFGIWERIQEGLDSRIKALGHDNVYFPLFIPLSYLEKEAEHVAGFAKECAVVTHHRLKEQDGTLIPDGQLEEPLVVRPTSEMIVGDSFSRWIDSWRDLPLKINQWCNIVRWEMRTRIFLRTSEFLWQEGHTAHATAEEAHEHAKLMHRVYCDFAEENCALPVIAGEKSESERFPGAVATYTLEAMMQDRKALQAGTSHFLGENFAKAQNIRYNDKDGQLRYCQTTSWGMTTRLIGAAIMVHGDDDGLRLPPRIAPKEIVIIPVIPKPEMAESVMAYAEKIAGQLRAVQYHGKNLNVQVDARDLRGGEKTWEWIKKGIPIRLEVGPRDIESGGMMAARRDKGPKEKEIIKLGDCAALVPQWLDEIQANYLAQAKEFQERHIRRDLESFDDFVTFFTAKNPEKPEIHGGFVWAKWCEDPASEEMLKELGVTVRCIPLDQGGGTGKCILTGREATTEAVFAKAY